MEEINLSFFIALTTADILVTVGQQNEVKRNVTCSVYWARLNLLYHFEGIFSLEPGNKATILVDKTIIFFRRICIKKSLVPNRG